MKKNDAEIRKVRDPVCGMAKPVEEMVAKSVYDGETYYFCTEGDKRMFDAHPDHWVRGKKDE